MSMTTGQQQTARQVVLSWFHLSELLECVPTNTGTSRSSCCRLRAAPPPLSRWHECSADFLPSGPALLVPGVRAGPERVGSFDHPSELGVGIRLDSAGAKEWPVIEHEHEKDKAEEAGKQTDHQKVQFPILKSEQVDKAHAHQRAD